MVSFLDHSRQRGSTSVCAMSWTTIPGRNCVKTHIVVLFQITQGSECLPVNVQCTGLPFQDELMLILIRASLSFFQITPGSEGLPVNVQCAGLPFQEELVLRLMKEIELGLNK